MIKATCQNANTLPKTSKNINFIVNHFMQDGMQLTVGFEADKIKLYVKYQNELMIVNKSIKLRNTNEDNYEIRGFLC